jgi:hypothetical protein
MGPQCERDIRSLRGHSSARFPPRSSSCEITLICAWTRVESRWSIAFGLPVERATTASLYTPYGYLVNRPGGVGQRVSHSREGRPAGLAWAT